MRTLEELERHAYISGSTELAGAYARAMDVESEQVDELEHEIRGLKDEVSALEDVRADLEEQLADAETKLEVSSWGLLDGR
jgi:predicted  nucleic acid-binding Zn-ribbon protein